MQAMPTPEPGRSIDGDPLGFPNSRSSKRGVGGPGSRREHLDGVESALTRYKHQGGTRMDANAISFPQTRRGSFAARFPDSWGGSNDLFNGIGGSSSSSRNRAQSLGFDKNLNKSYSGALTSSQGPYSNSPPRGRSSAAGALSRSQNNYLTRSSGGGGSNNPFSGGGGTGFSGGGGTIGDSIARTRF